MAIVNHILIDNKKWVSGSEAESEKQKKKKSTANLSCVIKESALMIDKNGIK